MDENMSSKRDSTQAIWGLEGLTLRQKHIFINGWIFAPGEQVESLSLELFHRQSLSSTQSSDRIVLDCRKIRNDVLQAHPDQPEALESGFLGAGEWQRLPSKNDCLTLSAQLNSGRIASIQIPDQYWQNQISTKHFDQLSITVRQWKPYFKQILGLAVRGQWSSLYRKLARHMRDINQTAAPKSLTPSMLLKLGASPSGKIHLILDHRLGGGANHYREKLDREWLNAGDTVLTLTFHLMTLCPALTVSTPKKQKIFKLQRLQDLITILRPIDINSLTYNTGVSFTGAHKIPDFLLTLKWTHRSRLTVLLHDFFPICPSHFLLNNEGQFCNIPDVQICRKCLPSNPNGFTSLFRGNITEWRSRWGALLQQADEIIAFSQSTVELIQKAYPKLAKERGLSNGKSIIVHPHKVDYLYPSPPLNPQTDRLVIGIIGQIGFHKGSAFIRDFAQEIETQGGTEEIAIIGSLEGRANPRVIRQSGPYRREELPQRIRESQANIFLFTSIWPETFSYVSQEIIELGLPLACFNYGAPAERVKTYERGLILVSQDPAATLTSLRQFFQQVYHKKTT